MLPQSTTPFQPPKLLNGINGVSLRIGTSAIHMPGSIEYLRVDNTVISVGIGIGPGTSASRWQKYALAILCWQQLTCTVSGAGTRPSAHTVTEPKKQSNIWCSAGPQIRDAPGATWNGLGRNHRPPPTGNEREKHVGVANVLKYNCRVQIDT